MTQANQISILTSFQRKENILNGYVNSRIVCRPASLLQEDFYVCVIDCGQIQ